MIVSLVGRTAIGSGRSVSPLLVTQATSSTHHRHLRRVDPPPHTGTSRQVAARRLCTASCLSGAPLHKQGSSHRTKPSTPRLLPITTHQPAMTNNIKVTLTYTAIHFVAISIALQSVRASYGWGRASHNQ